MPEPSTAARKPRSPGLSASVVSSRSPFARLRRIRAPSSSLRALSLSSRAPAGTSCAERCSTVRSSGFSSVPARSGLAAARYATLSFGAAATVAGGGRTGCRLIHATAPKPARPTPIRTNSAMRANIQLHPDDMMSKVAAAMAQPYGSEPWRLMRHCSMRQTRATSDRGRAAMSGACGRLANQPMIRYRHANAPPTSAVSSMNLGTRAGAISHAQAAPSLTSPPPSQPCRQHRAPTMNTIEEAARAAVASWLAVRAVKPITINPIETKSGMLRTAISFNAAIMSRLVAAAGRNKCIIGVEKTSGMRTCCGAMVSNCRCTVSDWLSSGALLEPIGRGAPTLLSR